MATNIGVELRRLLKKLEGEPSPYDQTNELIHKITDQVESGGSSDLPEVTPDDNGDVLTVVNGAWGKAAPSGGIQTIKPTISAFVDGQLPDGSYNSHKGYYQITFTGLAYNSLYVLDFSPSDLPANPHEDWVVDYDSTFYPHEPIGPVYYLYNASYEEAQMYDLLSASEPFVRSSEVSSGGATMVCYIVYYEGES